MIAIFFYRVTICGLGRAIHSYNDHVSADARGESLYLYRNMPGMLSKRPDYDGMSTKEQGRLRDIYTNTHGWLTKSVSQNSGVTSKAKKIESYPCPDVVKWWQTVHDMSSLSQSELERSNAKLHDHYQFDNEKCVTCFF